MPTVTINVPDSWTTKVRGQSLLVEAAKFTNLAEFAEAMFTYGAVNRWFNDKSAPQGVKAPAKDAPQSDHTAFAMECLANATAIRNDAYNGVYGKVREAREPTDPVADEARKIATAWVNAHLGTCRKPKGKDKEEWTKTDAQLATARAFASHAELDLSDGVKFHAAAIAFRAKMPDVVESARKAVEAKAEAKTIDVAALFAKA